MTNTREELNDAEFDSLLAKMAYASELEQLGRKDLIHIRKYDTSIFYLVKNLRNDVDHGRGYVGVQDIDDRNHIIKPCLCQLRDCEC